MKNATGFPASVSDPTQSQLIIGGGRQYLFGDNITQPWDYFTALSVIRNGNMEKFGDLPEPSSDHCMVITETGSRHRLLRRMWLIGGSNKPQRYRTDVYTKNVDDPHGTWIKMPDLLDARMWQGCVATEMHGQKGILVIGGYYNGVSSMFLALEDSSGQSREIYGLNRNMPKWEYVAGLTKERKWGPAIGFIGSNLAVAGGGDYGDETVDVLQSGSWRRSQVDMIYKREFCVGVTLPQQWFPECQF